MDNGAVLSACQMSFVANFNFKLFLNSGFVLYRPQVGLYNAKLRVMGLISILYGFMQYLASEMFHIGLMQGYVRNQIYPYVLRFAKSKMHV